MNKYLIGLSLMTLSLSSVPAVKQETFVELPSKKLTLEDRNEDISQYLISEGTEVSEEQKQELLNRIMAIIHPTTRSAASDSVAFDFFFGVGSEEYWERMVYIFLRLGRGSKPRGPAEGAAIPSSSPESVEPGPAPCQQARGKYS